MGYDYCIFIGLVSIPLEYIPYDPKSCDTYDAFVQRIVTEYNRFCEDQTYVKFEYQIGENDRGDLSTGACDDQSEFFPFFDDFSTRFPNVCFRVYITYWDHTCLTIHDFENGTHTLCGNYGNEGYFVKVDEYLTMNVHFDYDMMIRSVVKNDITQHFNKKYEYDCGTSFDISHLDKFHTIESILELIYDNNGLLLSKFKLYDRLIDLIMDKMDKHGLKIRSINVETKEVVIPMLVDFCKRQFNRYVEIIREPYCHGPYISEIKCESISKDEFVDMFNPRSHPHAFDMIKSIPQFMEECLE